MVCQRHIAVGASWHPPADVALYHRGKPTPVLKQNGLFATLQRLITGSSFTDAKFVLRPAEVDAAGETIKEAIELNWGNFVQTTVDFFIIAFCIFLLIKGMNSFRKKEEAKPAEPAPTPEDIALLREIRDELKRRG